MRARQKLTPAMYGEGPGCTWLCRRLGISSPPPPAPEMDVLRVMAGALAGGGSAPEEEKRTTPSNVST